MKAHSSLATPDPLEAGDRPGRKSRRTLRSRPEGGQPYRALDDDQPGVPPTDDFWGPLGRGVLSGTAESSRTSSTLQHHSPGRRSSDCQSTMYLQLHSRLAQMDPWLGQFGTGATGATARHDATTTMPGPCSESVPLRGGEGALRRHRRYDMTTRILPGKIDLL